MDFESIIGYKAIKLELSRILDQLKHPEKYAELGVTEPHGLLMHGVPGVGKSTMARCIVGSYSSLPRFGRIRGGIRLGGNRGLSVAHLQCRPYSRDLQCVVVDF